MYRSMSLTFGLIIVCLMLSSPVPTATQSLQAFVKLCDVKTFDDYLEQTNKVYADPKEFEYRKSIFVGKKTIIDMNNKAAVAGHSSFYTALNPLADLTIEEVSRLTGSKITIPGENITSLHINFVTNKPIHDGLPEQYDWREKGGVTPPGFQGFDCGACWSFSTIAALEGHLFRRTGVLVELSKQDLVDCADSYGTEGCEGGFQEYAFEYIRDHGITLEYKYPYIQTDNGRCQRNETTANIQIRDYARIKPGDEQRMKEIVATLGPLACSINAAPITFQSYMGGIYDDDECNVGEVNHSVTIVGYGTENGRDYWIIKNSYSDNWGENGFMKLPRNEKSFCGISSECSYPIL